MSIRFHRRPFVAALAAALIFSGSGTVVAIATKSVPAAFAQDQAGGPPPAAPHGRRMGQLLMALDLSDQQKSQIREIIGDARKQNQTVTDRDARRANMKAAYAKIDSVLTPAQRTQFHTKLDAMRQTSGTRAQ